MQHLTTPQIPSERVKMWQQDQYNTQDNDSGGVTSHGFDKAGAATNKRVQYDSASTNNFPKYVFKNSSNYTGGKVSAVRIEWLRTNAAGKSSVYTV